MFFMLVLILPSFVFFGIQGYNRFMETEGALATVDGTPITQREFEIAQRERVERLRQQSRPEVRSEAARHSRSAGRGARRLLLDRALTNEVERSNLVVTVIGCGRSSANVPAFQQDDKFSLERYKAYVARAGHERGGSSRRRVRSDLRKQTVRFRPCSNPR